MFKIFNEITKLGWSSNTDDYSVLGIFCFCGFFFNTAPQHNTHLCHLIPLPLPSSLASLQLSQVTQNWRCSHLSPFSHTLSSPSWLNPNVPTHPSQIYTKQPKTLLSAHGAVYINSLNFIRNNLVHHLQGMLYKKDETSVALMGIMHAPVNLNKYEWRDPICSYMLWLAESSKDDRRVDEGNAEI